jgi:hypothetical protein
MKIRNKILYLILCTTSLFGYPFNDNGDGSVTDTFTNLIWQKCSRGQNNDSTCSGTATGATWKNALLYCKNLNLNSRIWRLPNINELSSLINPAIYSSDIPHIDSVNFPSTQKNVYWSSTTYLWRGEVVSALTIYFNNGRNEELNKQYGAYVRCVSGP